MQAPIRVMSWMTMKVNIYIFFIFGIKVTYPLFLMIMIPSIQPVLQFYCGCFQRRGCKWSAVILLNDDVTQVHVLHHDLQND